MPSGEGEIKMILGFLEKRYPKGFDSVESLKSKIPALIDADRLLENLIYCFEQGYLNTSPIETEGEGIVDFYDIKISASGIRYLRGSN
jgi:hypothetical protein